jgi:ABC-type nitrate/sulfonate/bicarbonate transport system substrate-binding protein
MIVPIVPHSCLPTRRRAMSLLGGAAASASMIGSLGRASAATSISFGAPRIPHYAAAWLVRDYMPAELTVELVEFKAGAEMVTALVSGSVDVGAIGYWHLIRLLDQGVDVEAVAGLASGGTRLVVRKGVAVKDWADLKGKTCAVMRGSIQDVQFLMALKKHGLTPADVNYRDLGSNLAVHWTALQQGEIDASAMTEPFASKIIQEGLAYQFSTLYDDSFRINGVVVARSGFIKANPYAVKTIANALVKSTDRLNGNSTEFVDFTAKLSGFSPDVMAMAVQNVMLDYNMPEQEARRVASAVHEFGYAQSDVGAQLGKALNYSFLSEVTGKSPKALGAQQ